MLKYGQVIGAAAEDIAAGRHVPTHHRYAVTTGLGSACKPSPSIKLATNSDIYDRMPDAMDINCGAIATGDSTVAEKCAEILDYLIAAASGTKIQSEEMGYGSMEFVPWHIGAVV